jgi:hypothetical protein
MQILVRTMNKKATTRTVALYQYQSIINLDAKSISVFALQKVK